MLGTSLGNYRVVEPLGEGRMGMVYIGHHETLGDRVAIKVLLAGLPHSAETVQRFFDEARAASELRNPGIVQVLDVGTTADGRAYVVTELLEGESLGARLKQRRHDAAECCRFGRQVANVLQVAHTKGITHGALKPENLFLVPDNEGGGGERVKLLDFGIARLASGAQPGSVKPHTSLMMGTLDYMSPEQCRSASAADGRSDIYSLGCILFELACGRPPFIGGDSVVEVIAAHLHEQPPNPLSLTPDLVVSVGALITHMLAKRPDARPQTMAEVSRALDHILRAIAETSAWPTPRSSSSLRSLPSASLRVPTPTSEPSLGASTPQAWSRSSAPGRAGVRWLPAVLGAVVLAVATTAVAFVLADDPPRAAEHQVPSGEADRCNAAELAEKALAQLRDDQYAASLALYEAAYACEPSPSLLQKAFVVACNLHDLPKVKAYWKRMPVELRPQADATCVRNGITAEMLDEP